MGGTTLEDLVHNSVTSEAEELEKEFPAEEEESKDKDSEEETEEEVIEDEDSEEESEEEELEEDDDSDEDQDDENKEADVLKIGEEEYTSDDIAELIELNAKSEEKYKELETYVESVKDKYSDYEVLDKEFRTDPQQVVFNLAKTLGMTLIDDNGDEFEPKELPESAKKRIEEAESKAKKLEEEKEKLSQKQSEKEQIKYVEDEVSRVFGKLKLQYDKKDWEDWEDNTALISRARRYLASTGKLDNLENWLTKIVSNEAKQTVDKQKAKKKQKRATPKVTTMTLARYEAMSEEDKLEYRFPENWKDDYGSDGRPLPEK